ncbi:DUF4350 domain-containing protein [Winogradskyella maritima]|uniref:DUF4350 domain-containing protein n=1 Tax=Winogradskyella maritima TaxID=1517766 RepID=A0ABV8AJB5_9FLAO|nr:DUF4350 domain-containing protein [Winogradskyella maritima]
MSKKGKLYIALASLVILGLVFAEVTKPKPINWFPSYTTHHKIPFGSYVFKEQLERLSDQVQTVDRPPFEYLRNNDISGTYVFYNNGVSFDDAELEILLNWTAKGNTLFVASGDIGYQLMDTLNLDTSVINTFNNFNNQYQVKLANPNLDKNTTYVFDKANFLYHFTDIDSSQTKIIGLVDKYSDSLGMEQPLANAIKQPFGDGNIILSTFPQAFTNYFMLNSPNQDYTAGLLSYINLDAPIYLDAHYKSGKKFYTSPMYLFLNNRYLKWAYYMALIGVLFYIIFEGRRKQRAIPVVKPLTNQTIAFTRTISDMYYQSSKHKKIAEHKIQHFLEYIRNVFHLQTSQIDASFLKNLASRSNNSLEDTEHLFQFISDIQNNQTINNIQLERLNSLIETFKSHNTWKTS